MPIPPVPSYAAAEGYTELDPFSDDFDSISTIDVNDSRTLGFKWRTHTSISQWGNFYSPTAPTDYSVANSVCTVYSEPLAGCYALQSACDAVGGPVSTVNGWMGYSFPAGFYVEVRVRQIGTAIGGCWMLPVPMRTHQLLEMVEIDISDPWDGLRQRFNCILWDYADANMTHSHLVQPPETWGTQIPFDFSSFHRFGILWKRMRDNNGQGSFHYFIDGVEYLSAGIAPLIYSAGSRLAGAESCRYFFLFGNRKDSNGNWGGPYEVDYWALWRKPTPRLLSMSYSTTDSQVPAVVTDLVVNRDNATTISVTFSAVARAFNYQRRYRPIGGAWSTWDIIASGGTISGLTSGVYYEVQVKALGGAGESISAIMTESAWAVSWSNDFVTMPAIVGPSSKTGWFPSRIYANAVGTAYPERTVMGAPIILTDPLYTGYNDSNRGVALGFNNIRAANSVLTLQSRAATAAESANFMDPVNNVTLGSQIQSIGLIQLCPGTGTNATNAVEYRFRARPAPGGAITTASIGGGAWLIGSNIPNRNSGLQNEVDTSEIYQGQLGWHFHYWVNGSVADPVEMGSTNAFAAYLDGNWHTLRWELNHSGGTCWIDGNQVVSTTYDPNTANQPMHFILESRCQLADAAFIASGTSDTSGIFFDVDWVKISRRLVAPHYMPLATVSSILVDYAGYGSIILPSKAALWGDANVNEFVQCVPFEIDEPGMGGPGGVPYYQFPPGVTYDSATRTISVDFSTQTTGQAGKAGRLHCLVSAYSDGSTCQPATFTIDRAPRVTTANYTVNGTHGSAFSHDFYHEADVGIILPKTISFTGLPAGLSDNGQGLVTGTPTSAGTTSVTVNVTNAAGQTSSQAVSFVIA